MEEQKLLNVACSVSIGLKEVKVKERNDLFKTVELEYSGIEKDSDGSIMVSNRRRTQWSVNGTGRGISQSQGTKP